MGWNSHRPLWDCFHMQPSRAWPGSNRRYFVATWMAIVPTIKPRALSLVNGMHPPLALTSICMARPQDFPASTFQLHLSR